MFLKKWDQLPGYMQTEEVKPYYDYLVNKKVSLLIKRVFDIIVGIILLVILSPVFLIISVSIVIDSRGGVLFKQERVTRYGKKFKIYKFRTMVVDAEKIGTQVTLQNDVRITRVGNFLRKFRLDEFPQLLNVISGDMSFVGTRPETPGYVMKYSDEMFATLLMPAGITSEASIAYRDESDCLANAEDADREYVENVLPLKMKYNLDSIMRFSFIYDIKTMFKTVMAVCNINTYKETNTNANVFR